MSRVFRLCLFITSFFPLWITIAFLEGLSIYEGGPNLKTEYAVLTILLLAVLPSTWVVVKGIKMKKKKKGDHCTIREAVRANSITSEYLLSYILPLFAFDFTWWRDVAIFLFYFAVLAFLCLRNNNVYVNPLLELMGYHIFNCRLEFLGMGEPVEATLLSTNNPAAKIGHGIQVERMNAPVYIEV